MILKRVQRLIFLLIIISGFILFVISQLYKTKTTQNEKTEECHPYKQTQTIRKTIIINKQFPYKNYSVQDPIKFSLSTTLDSNKNYFVTIGKHTCFVDGTKSVSDKLGCQCFEEKYFGKWCSFPNALKSVKSFDVNKLTIRTQPRRVVYSSPFNHEFVMLEARLAELGEIVDVFVYGESNYTAHGDKKDLFLLDKLKNGYMGHMQQKICHVYYGYFPKAGYKDGWLIDDLMRNVLGKGIKEQIKGLRHEDIIIMTDSDELPNKETVLFLKLHDGYPEPISVALDKRTYGFFWKVRNPHIIGFASTFGFLWHVFKDEVRALRNPVRFIKLGSSELKAYMKAGGSVVKYWQIGDAHNRMGWHCSWCARPEGIQTKLVSAINADFPRWGDYPEKRDLEYIKKLVQTGMWFDGKSGHEKLEPDVSTDYAPKYLIDNWKMYKYLLVNPYS